MIRVLVLAAAICAAAPCAFSQQAPSAPAVPAPPDPAAFAAFQAKANLYATMLLDGRQVVIDMVDYIGTINRLSVDPALADKPFDASFGSMMKARSDALAARIAAAPPIAGSEAATLYPPGNETVAQAAKLVDSYPAALKDIQAAGADLIGKTLELGPAAQKGEAKAQLALAGAMFGGMKAAVAAENLQLELGGTTYMPVHPQHALTESSVASNRAMMEFFGMMHNQAEGRSVNLVGAARRIRAYAEESRVAAESVPKLTQDMIATLQNQQQTQGRSLAPDYLKALDSYRTSATNEIAITDHLASIAVILAEKGVSTGVEGDWSDIESLIDRRFQLDEGRRAALSR